jgi:hypothetical protein
VVLELPEEWWSKFVSTDNFMALTKNFDKVNFKTLIELEYIEVLSEIIRKMLTINQEEDKNISVYP